MSAGKGAKRTTSGSAGKKTTYSDETNHAAVSPLPNEDDSSRWVSTLAPLTLLKAVSKHAAKLNENRMLYNVTDATKVAMVTPTIVNFGLQKGKGKEKEGRGKKKRKKKTTRRQQEENHVPDGGAPCGPYLCSI